MPLVWFFSRASFPQPDEMDRYFSFNTHLFQVSIPSASPQLDLVTVADQQAVIEARNRAAAPPSSE